MAEGATTTSPSSAPATSACRSRPRSPRRAAASSSSTSLEDVVDALNRGESHIEDVPSERLAPLVEQRPRPRDDRLRRARRVRRDPDRAADAALAPARARPLDRRRPRRAASREVLREGQLVVLESTTWPGTTREVLQPILEEGSGLRVGRGLLPRDVAGARRPGPRGLDDEDDAEGARRDHARVHARGPPSSTAARSTPSTSVSSPEAAELTKLLENIFRSVNIALVNELAILCDRMGIDIWEVVDAAATKPFGYMRFSPGPGPRRPLHPGRSVLPHVEGARVRLLHGVHRARRQGQRGDAVLLPLARLAGAQPPRAAAR